jgi:hypothetical protein
VRLDGNRRSLEGPGGQLGRISNSIVLEHLASRNEQMGTIRLESETDLRGILTAK